MKRILTLLACLALPLAAPAPAQTLTPDSANIDRDAAARSTNLFALSLYGQLRGGSANLFFSPGSLSTALSMVYGGAQGDTAAEMAHVLHFTLPPVRLHPAMGELVREMNASGALDGYALSSVNALWLQQDFPFLPAFTALTQQDYGAALTNVDFKTDPNDVRATINEWVAQQTEQKIRQLIPQGALTSATRLVLTNAIYFKGRWAVPFEAKDTRDEPFQVSAAQAPATAMMHRTGTFGYFKGMDFQALQIPYKGGALAMVIVLPGSADGLPSLETQMTRDALAQWCEKLDGGVREVQVSLPKFTVSAEFQLSRTLTTMGMPTAFDPRAADFSGMADMSQARERLFISKVMHKAYIAVDEEGTEAAAATAVIFETKKAQNHPIFRADHPFVFLIRDTRSGAILFMGRVMDPTKS